jgi:hypothetical protein
MFPLYQGTAKSDRSGYGWVIVLAVFVLTILSAWQILDAVFPPPPAASTTSMEKLRSDFNGKFGADRTTVREAEYYRDVTPSPGGAP